MTSATATAAPRPMPGRKQSPVRAVVRGLGELMITFGVIMLLLVLYQLVYTNFEANRAQDALKGDLRESWSAGADDGRGGGKGKGERATPIPGSAIGIMYIPRLGEDWEKPIVEGVDLDSLARGVGHFPANAQPGEVGNFAVAAHRATHGEPFANLDGVVPGDQVIVETRDKYFVYETTAEYKLVSPNYGDVVFPVPEQPGVEPTEKLITLVTCNPRWGSSTRLIIYGEMVKSYNKKDGTLPRELAYTRA